MPITCIHCADEHMQRECPNKGNKQKCANCIKENQTNKDNKLTEDHSTFSDSCQILQRLKKAFIKRTDYLT